jgi:triosephosphate isomerase
VKKLIVNACRLVLAVTFVFSGFVKAVDPHGTQYKIEDYLEAMHLGGLVPSNAALILAVAMATVEFCLGIFMMFAIRRRFTSRMTLALMLVMTPLTLWLAVANPISDCGCFGDALVLTNWQTLWKNVVLLAMAAAVAWNPMEMFRFVSKSNQWIVINYSVVFMLIVSGWSIYYLPQFDFRPYHIGADLRKGMELPTDGTTPEEDYVFIYEKNGERREYAIDNLPDSVAETWTFVERKEGSKATMPDVLDFAIQQGEDDITAQVLNDTSYTFLLVSHRLEKADDSRFDLINELYEYSLEHGYAFYCLTPSSEEAIQEWSSATGAEYPFCFADETLLKTVIRSNPGLVLMKDGVVMGKWSHNDLPALKPEQMGMPLEQLPMGQMPSDSVPGKIMRILLWFVLPLSLLTIADRTWMWTKWIRRKKVINKTYLTTKRKTMRKKIVAGNWKMNMNLQDGIALAKELNETLKADKPNCGVVICTPFIHLASIAAFLDQDIIGLGAENCADKEKGAYTGEVSAEMVKSTGAQYVILGHSERREYYKETPEILKEKVLLAQKNGLKVIFCIGESLDEREAGKQNEVVKAELEGSVFNLAEEDFRKIVIAYEPIWAIGTGKTATAEQAEEIHAYIRSIIADKYGKDVAEDTTILYGGSCKASNAPELFAKPDIDGGLIGGASLKAADFKGIIDAWKK